MNSTENKPMTDSEWVDEVNEQSQWFDEEGIAELSTIYEPNVELLLSSGAYWRCNRFQREIAIESRNGERRRCKLRFIVDCDDFRFDCADDAMLWALKKNIPSVYVYLKDGNETIAAGEIRVTDDDAEWYGAGFKKWAESVMQYIRERDSKTLRSVITVCNANYAGDLRKYADHHLLRHIGLEAERSYENFIDPWKYASKLSYAWKQYGHLGKDGKGKL